MGQRDLEDRLIDISEALHFHRSLCKTKCSNHMLQYILLSFQVELNFLVKIL